MQDYQVLFNIAVALSGFFGGLVLAGIYKSIDRLDTDVRNIPKEYVPKADFNRAMDELGKRIKDGFTEINDNFRIVFNKLDDKEDKSASIATKNGNKH